MQVQNVNIDTNKRIKVLKRYQIRQVRQKKQQQTNKTKDK